MVAGDAVPDILAERKADMAGATELGIVNPSVTKLPPHKSLPTATTST